MEALWSDLKFGVRMLLRSPGFALVAILTLALGIGANTALFSLVNGILLAPLRFPQADRLVALYQHKPEFEYSSISYPNFLDWQRDNQTFQSVAAFRPDDFSLTGLGEPQRINGVMVSANFFPTLGVNPVIGRDFDPQQDVLGGKPEVMISAGMWKSKFGAAPDVIGKSLTLNGTDYTIVGVVPASFHLFMQNFRTSDIYVPVGQWDDVIFHQRDVGMGMNAVARLKPGVSTRAGQRGHGTRHATFRGGISGREFQNQRHRSSTEGQNRWRCAAVPLGVARSGVFRFADCLRERRESATGPRHATSARVCHSRRVGRRQVARHPAASHRKRAAFAVRRRSWIVSRKLGNARRASVSAGRFAPR